MTIEEDIFNRLLIASYGFGIYTIPGGFAIADPLDNQDGFYLVGSDLNGLCRDAVEQLIS